jgi:hypothetical protein
MKSILTILEQLEQSILKTTKTKPIADAVKNRKLITFYYTGPRIGKDKVKPGYRIKAEGVALGLTKKGKLALRAFVQPPSASKKGFAKTGWRTFLLNRMNNVKISEETFDIKRPEYHEGDDRSFSVTYVTSDWSQTPEVEPQAEPQPAQVEPQAEPQTAEPSIEPAKPTAEPVEPTSEPTVEPTPQIKPEPKATELPQPKPRTKPSKEPQTTIQPQQSTEPNPENPEIAPEEKPEEEEDTNLMESLKRIKRLMYSQNYL